MTKEDYRRELDAAGGELQVRLRALTAAANPLNLIRGEVARDWKWWLPGASVAGFAAARFWRGRPGRTRSREAGPAAGAAFWIPTLLRLLPAVLAQLMPLLLGLRSGRKD